MAESCDRNLQEFCPHTEDEFGVKELKWTVGELEEVKTLEKPKPSSWTKVHKIHIPGPNLGTDLPKRKKPTPFLQYYRQDRKVNINMESIDDDDDEEEEENVHQREEGQHSQHGVKPQEKSFAKKLKTLEKQFKDWSIYRKASGRISNRSEYIVSNDNKECSQKPNTHLFRPGHADDITEYVPLEASLSPTKVQAEAEYITKNQRAKNKARVSKGFNSFSRTVREILADEPGEREHIYPTYSQ